MSNYLHASDSPLSCIKLTPIAKQTGLILRQSARFSARSILLAFLKCVHKGDASFHHLALEITLLNEHDIGRTALHKRVGAKLVAFLEGVLGELLLRQSAPLGHIGSGRFSRILIEDSTFVPMGPLNAGNFPACGNQAGVGAGFKLDLVVDLLGQSILRHQFGAGSKSDKRFGDAVIEMLRPGDLLLRDMGYYSQNSLQAITRTGADWVSRVPVNVELRRLNGHTIEKTLRPRGNRRIDEIVEVGKEGFRARLVGVRLDDAVAASKRRTRKANHAKRGSTPSHGSLVRDGWCLMLTSLGPELSAEEIVGLYKARWNIETRFKAWKQSLDQKQSLKRYTNYEHLQCIVLAALIHQMLAHHVFRIASAKIERTLSIEKISEVVSSYISTLKKGELRAPIPIIPRLVTMDSRKRKPLLTKILHTK